MKFALIALGIFMIGTGYSIMVVGFKYNPTKDFARQIRDCFPKEGFKVNSFVVGGARMEDEEGNAFFYPAKDVKETITKLNKVLDETND